MSEPSAVLALQAEALIALLQRDQTTACATEAQMATARARETLHAAHREARRLVREAVQDERNRRDVVLAQTRATLETRNRQRANRDASRIVRAAWAQLPASLQSLWSDAAVRQAWCATAIAAAARVLQTDRWEIHCALPAQAPELKDYCAHARAQGVREAAALGRAELVAGIAIRSAGATFDATLAGLLSVPEAIQAELHAEWLAQVTS